MDADGRTRRVSHPILRLDVLTPEGTKESLRVFCQYQGRSVPVGVCCACKHCDAIQPEPAPSVDCTVPLIEKQTAADPQGTTTEVGKLLKAGTLVIDEKCSFGIALDLLRAGEHSSVAVVDADQILLGIVHEMSTELCEAFEPVTTAMSSAVAIHEAMPIRKALRLLASTHSRQATVVTSDGKPLGIFRDVDGMAWIARARRQAER
jgi:CBS domain-containing protein